MKQDLMPVYFQTDHQVLTVDWSDASEVFYYTSAVVDIRPVAREIVLMLENLIKSSGITKDHLWCVGHSLGSHICGEVGMQVSLGRITGQYQEILSIDSSL